MSESIIEKEPRQGSLKTFVVIALIVLLIPIMTVGVLYAASQSFRQSTNQVLTLIPGPLGSYFRNLPTPEDQALLKREIAKHYIMLDQDRIVDKLLVIRAENESLYQELLILMNRENPRKMSDVTEKLQRAFINDDTLLRILEEVEQDRRNQSSALSTYLTSLSRPLAVQEIERMIDSGELRHHDLGQLFQQITPDQAAFYLRHLNPSLAQQIRNQLPGSLITDIDKRISAQIHHEKELIHQAGLYERKRVEELIPVLTGDSEHSLSDLAFLYHQITIAKGGSILAQAESQDFLQRLMKEMISQESLVETRTGKTAQLTESIRIHQEYQRRVQELAGVYQRMNLSELAPLVERMLVSNTIVEQHIFSPEEQIIITEEQLVLDVLNRMRPVVISELLGQLSTPRAVLLSQKLFGE